MLSSEKFQQDPRLKKAKDLILETLNDHQELFKGPLPANPATKIYYDNLIKDFSELRGNSLWYPFIGSGFGKGALVELLDGSVKYDFISGIGVHFFGHSSPLIIESSLEAALSDTVMEGHLQQNVDSIDLSQLLVDESGLSHCFLTSSGVMANENALKIALQKKFPAKRILAFDRCFVGRTLAISQITDKPQYREGLPAGLRVDYIPFYDASKPEESINEALKAIKKAIYRYPNEHAVMILEMVQGEGGCYPGSPAFFKSIVTLLKENEIPVFVDEVQTFGRTPSLFAYRHFGLEIEVDIVTIGKLSQVCATLFKSEFAPKPGLLSQTFTGAVSAIRAAYVIIEKLRREGYYGEEGRMQEIQNRFKARFEEIQFRHPQKISGPWGIGAMVAFTYKEGDAKETNDLAKRLYEAGLITFVAGSSPTRIRMLPPALVLKDHEIDEACGIIESCL